MIEFTVSPTERTTAVTDLLLAAVALFGVAFLRGYRLSHPWKVSLWSRAFALLGVAATLGAIVHGVVLASFAKVVVWCGIHLCLALTIAHFFVAALSDRFGESGGRRAFFIVPALAVVFFALTITVPGGFFIFLLYEGLAMFAALVMYTELALRNRLPGAWWMVCGILLSLAAAVLQASKHAVVTFGWEFDHNGTFHLVQTVALLALFVGLSAALAGRKP